MKTEPKHLYINFLIQEIFFVCIYSNSNAFYFGLLSFSLTSRNGSSVLEDSLGNNGSSQKMIENIQDFDEKFKNHRPQHDKSMMKKAVCISTLRVSWNLIEAEICHNPGKEKGVENGICKHTF